MIRGLSVNREENAVEDLYHKWVDIEDMGLVIYTPLSVSDPDIFSNPETNKTVYD
jgi:hypothetical protein